jgi:AmmeMemoRadiSam system protein A
MNDSRLAETYGALLGAVAADALRHGLIHASAASIKPADFPEPLQTPRATFVTLEEAAALRGCIGSLAARQSLVEDVAANAYGAGFRDPRFPPLTEDAFARLSISISILGPFEVLACTSEDDLFARARAGIDGFVLSAEGRRGLFLPQVWETLRTPQAFFDTLREKAGLPSRYWSSQLRIERFQVTSIPKRDLAGFISI